MGGFLFLDLPAGNAFAILRIHQFPFFLKLIKNTPKGIFCIPGKFYIDPWRPVDLAVITHGHGDHARWGMKKYLCHHLTRPILQHRLGADISVESIDYNESVLINGVRLSLHPAGHIVGSAQVRLEYKGYVAVISGDYKLQDDGLSTPFEPVKCNEFVTESTFGLPIYNWLSVDALNDQLRTWVARNRENAKTSVLFGYSLGKAQRLMKAVDGLGEIYTHRSVFELNQIMESSGVELPEYKLLSTEEDKKSLKGNIIIAPPALYDSRFLRKIGDRSTAICSGWMQVRGARRWRSADAGFAVSDHADWQSLITAVKETGAERVHVTHGQTAVFSKYLNEIGIAADEFRTHYGQDEEVLENPNAEPEV